MALGPCHERDATVATDDVYERTKCGICGKRLTRGNCNWATFPGICRECGPIGAPHSGAPIERSPRLDDPMTRKAFRHWSSKKFKAGSRPKTRREGDLSEVEDEVKVIW